ncbi:MAG: hypothetical protein HY736_05905 [Verrucomicrobia bacterium]|nr:hypothetical protein [Verrucomicrobiota bacterium]
MATPTVSSVLLHRVFSAGRLALGLLGAGGLAGANLPGAELRVGRARVVITPPVGSVMGNSYGITVATGVTSNIHAKAVVFETADGKAALVACDLISLHTPIVARARALIAEKTGVPPDRVILAATHCHAGPQTHPLLFSLAGGAAQKLSEAYVEKLPGLIAESVRLAEADLQPAKIFAGSGSEDSISFNRRFLLRDGTVRMNPGQNPDKVRPMGPIDPQVGVVYIESADGKPLVTVVNFALHVAVVGGSQISSDYPHTLAETLGRVKGDAMLTVFLNGMSGNINHVNAYVSSRLRAEAEAARIGTILAAAVLKTYPNLRPVEATRLRAVSRSVRVPVLPAPTPSRLAEARATLRRHGKGATFAEVIRAWRDIDLAQYGADGTWNSEVQAIVFGRDLALVGYPGDSFVELGLAMKQNSPFGLTFVSEQSGNGAISYIPNEKAFPEGSYEVDSARVAPGGGEVLANAAIRLLTELFPRP